MPAVLLSSGDLQVAEFSRIQLQRKELNSGEFSYGRYDNFCQFAIGKRVMDSQKIKHRRQLRRRNHVRRKVVGTAERPRMSVFRSSKHIYVQLIDDLSGLTLGAASTTGKEAIYGGNIKAAKIVGQKIAELAKTRGIEKVAFDRGHYRYHGRVKALADAAREAGLQF